jgi:hypothetical protein
MGDATFWTFTTATTLASFVAVATTVHLIVSLTERGVSPAAAGAALAGVGLLQLPGRALYGPLRRHLPWQATASAIFLLQAAAIAALAWPTGRLSLALFVCLFGIGNGIATLLRASTVAELYGSELYGRVAGVVSLFGTLARAAAPTAASLAYVTFGGYAQAFTGLIVLLIVAAVVVAVPMRTLADRAGSLGTAASRLP